MTKCAESGRNSSEMPLADDKTTTADEKESAGWLLRSGGRGKMPGKRKKRMKRKSMRGPDDVVTERREQLQTPVVWVGAVRNTDEKVVTGLRGGGIDDGVYAGASARGAVA